MSKDVEFKNRDRFIQLGIAIAALRKMRGMSQEELAYSANISRSHLSAIEAPGLVRPFSLEVFFNIADALEIDPADLINAAVFPDKILSNTNKSLTINATQVISCVAFSVPNSIEAYAVLNIFFLQIITTGSAGGMH